MRWILYPLILVVGLFAIGIAIAAIVLVLTYPNLPSLEALTDYRPKVPLRVFTADGHLIGEFGEERRNVVRIEDVPAAMKQAILAAEDERFYQHGGIDTLGMARAAIMNLTSGGKKQGASTITQQVARNFFLSSEKTYTRKLYEVLLSFKIEHNLSKDQILELYVNQIFLGQRAYGFSAAAQIYFGKPLKDLTPAEAAMLAGLPKAPSTFNPVVNPKRAKLRQQYVLRRSARWSAASISTEQVQPRHPGLAPAGLQLQALHLLGGAGKGLHAGLGDQRRTAQFFDAGHRQPGLGAEELRRQVRRPDALRTALAKSKNMVSIRVLQPSAPSTHRTTLTRFGFDADKHPAYLTMALGAGSVTPWQMVSAYACSPTAATGSSLTSSRHS
jgi:membrane carboxypeptidase/penicillin-binding protein